MYFMVSGMLAGNLVKVRNHKKQTLRLDKALVVYEPEAAIVRMMFENYLSGQSTSELSLIHI